MKKAGEELTLTYFGPPLPVPPDVIETTTGRRYEVLAVRPGGNVTASGPRYRFRCRVMRKSARVIGAVLHWRWLSRGNRERCGTRRRV
jgi:hypothetical protein